MRLRDLHADRRESPAFLFGALCFGVTRGEQPLVRASRASKVAGAFLVLFWHAKENIPWYNRAILLERGLPHAFSPPLRPAPGQTGLRVLHAGRPALYFRADLIPARFPPRGCRVAGRRPVRQARAACRGGPPAGLVPHRAFPPGTAGVRHLGQPRFRRPGGLWLCPAGRKQGLRLTGVFRAAGAHHPHRRTRPGRSVLTALFEARHGAARLAGRAH